MRIRCRWMGRAAAACACAVCGGCFCANARLRALRSYQQQWVCVYGGIDTITIACSDCGTTL